MSPAQKALLEKRGGWDVGRDPRRVSRDELIAAGHKPMSAQKALRARCLALSEEVLEARRRGGRIRAAQFEKSAQGGSSDAERTLPAATLPAEPSAPRNTSPEQDFQAEAGEGAAG